MPRINPKFHQTRYNPQVIVQIPLKKLPEKFLQTVVKNISLNQIQVHQPNSRDMIEQRKLIAQKLRQMAAAMHNITTGFGGILD